MAVYGLSKEDHGRMSSVVRQIEGAYRGGGIPPRASSNTPWNPGSIVAKNGGSTIAAMSGSTPGSGTVTLYGFDGTTLASGETATAFNLAADTVAANAWLVLSYVGGFWFVTWEECPA